MFACLCQCLGISTALLAIVVVALFYLLVIKYWTFFSDRNVLFVRGLPILGSNYKTFLGRESLFDAMQRLYARYPDESIVGMYDIGGIPQFIVRDPELIKNVAVKQFDNFVNRRVDINPDIDPLAARNLFFVKDTAWREMRATLSPSFTGSKMRAMLALVTKSSRQFVDQLSIETAATAGAGVYEMKDTFSRYAADTIATCAFGLEVNSLADKENDFFRTGVSATQATLLFMLKFLGFSTVPRFLALLRVRLLKL